MSPDATPRVEHVAMIMMLKIVAVAVISTGFCGPCRLYCVLIKYRFQWPLQALLCVLIKYRFLWPLQALMCVMMMKMVMGSMMMA